MTDKKAELQLKHCDTLGYDVITQTKDGRTVCLSSELCNNKNCTSAINTERSDSSQL